MSSMEIAVQISVDGREPIPGVLIQTVDFDVVRSSGLGADTKWNMVDAAGHYHAYNQSIEISFRSYVQYPTLRELLREHGCDSENCTINGSCEGYLETYYQCRICSEEIRPGTTSVETVIREPRSVSWVVNLYPTSQFIDISKVSVRMFVEERYGQWFGVAQVTDALIEHGAAGYTLVGLSDLGVNGKVPL